MSKPPTKAPPTEPKSFRVSSSGMASCSSSRLHPWGRSGAPTTSNSVPRHSSNPLVRSPLQQSFPAYPDSKSAPNSPPAIPGTPSRHGSRASEREGRPRGESRSSSVPIAVRTPQEPDTVSESQSQTDLPFQLRTRPSSRATSPVSRPEGRNGQDRRSVKHLTCFWWWEKGECRFSDEDCLYSHYDTGHYTAAPRQVVPGEPAKAGKSLERALNKLAITNRSSTSVSTLTNNASNWRDGTASAAVSRAGTPFIERSRSSTPSSDLNHNPSREHITNLKSDNDFLRTLVQQTQREKRALMDTIECLQAKISSLLSQVEALTAEKATLLTEREVLQATVKKLQFSNMNSNLNANSLGSGVAAAPMPLRSPTTTAFPSFSHNPWGTIGSGRISPNESPALQQRTVSSGFGNAAAGGGGGNAAPVGPIRTNSFPNFNNNNNVDSSSISTSTSMLNPITAVYGVGHGNDSGGASGNAYPSLDNGASEKLRSVLRNLGPTF